jgi:hypothetical protein
MFADSAPPDDTGKFRLWSHSTLSTSGLTVYLSITIKDVPAEPRYGFQISGVPSA